MRAMRAYRKEFLTAPDQQDLFFAHRSEQAAAIGDGIEGNSIFEVRLFRTHVARPGWHFTRSLEEKVIEANL